MVPTLEDISDLLEQIAPSQYAEEWDNPGLQVGCFSQKIRKILVSLDPSLHALREASNMGAQLLLTHHPLIFGSLSRIDKNVYPGDVICEALRKGVSVLAAHTNLDVSRSGINEMLASLFGLREVEVLLRRNGIDDDESGLGRIGDLPEPVTLSRMAATVKSTLGADRIKVVGHNNSRIKRVAVVGGSGGKLVSISSEKGADLLITGDVGHHEALEANALGLALIDGGHFHTERVALYSFASTLKQTLKNRGWDISVEIYEDEKDPMRYV